MQERKVIQQHQSTSRIVSVCPFANRPEEFDDREELDLCDCDELRLSTPDPGAGRTGTLGTFVSSPPASSRAANALDLMRSCSGGGDIMGSSDSRFSRSVAIWKAGFL